MKDILDSLDLKVVKKLSETRWSARHDAVSASLDGYSHIISAFFQIAKNLEQKIETRATAKGLLNKINNSGFTVLLCFWKTISERFNKNQFELQRSDITLTSTCEVYSYLKKYVMPKRGSFEAFEKEAITLCGNERYLVSRNRKKKHPADGSTTEITQESCRGNINRIFIEIIDN